MIILPLTRWHTLSTFHGTPIYINAERIVAFAEITTPVARTEGEKRLSLLSRPKETRTWIKFDGDDNNVEEVCESAHYILERLPV